MSQIIINSPAFLPIASFKGNDFYKYGILDVLISILDKSLNQKTLIMRKQSKCEKVYQVETIIDEAILNYQPHYLIKWKNLGHQYDTWEPISDLYNIREYLQFWINLRKQKNNKVKAAKEKNYKSIKPYLYGGELLSKKKTGKYARFGEEILSRKKIWEKYIEQQEKYISLDEDDGIEAEFLRKNKGIMDEILNNGNKLNKSEVAKQQIYEEEQSVPKEEINVEEQPKEKHFKVVGSINLKNIKKIHRLFTWKDTKCLQVEMNDNKMFNIKQSEIKVSNPEMLLQFYENENIKF